MQKELKDDDTVLDNPVATRRKDPNDKRIDLGNTVDAVSSALWMITPPAVVLIAIAASATAITPVGIAAALAAAAVTALPTAVLGLIAAPYVQPIGAAVVLGAIAIDRAILTPIQKGIESLMNTASPAADTVKAPEGNFRDASKLVGGYLREVFSNLDPDGFHHRHRAPRLYPVRPEERAAVLGR